MFDSVKRIFEKTKNVALIKNAVKKNYIIPEQYKEITGEEYAA